MASRNMQINLQFNANVKNARAQLQSLQTQLNNLINSNTTSTSLGITPQIQEATRSAMDLKIALNNAMNVNTGKLNLNKFQSELNRMGRDIGYFAQQMGRLGPEGVKAFTQVASAVAQADTKLFSLQGGMKKLANTFMNTVRWQLTSQAIMAVTSAVSETVSYAKELDTSLNNIRIVTGKSADQMATFAKQANNAAKALSTSTTKYTDASLIYYQQGLNDKAVKERTDVTVKLANVVGESAETVSEWMTAIWNNFDDGSEKLEYYADILAKLGAATASSADEIAGGLEKFAAVAETIGLSYEYAASALATITAETRQSEDVVGTALKTILSRMEQLKQGDTLEDGTTLGQYSLALQKVGVDIKDASGELKDMDIILQQTGTRWETLGRDQQIALAQSVAGIRQYTQFMALMDNWDVMEKNLELTEQANGALTEQQRIYEESTKAAEERMKVAGEAIKATLLGGDDMTKLYDIGAGALEIINELLEAFGGLPTILLAVASALTKIYQPQVASFLSQTALAGKDLWMNIRHPIKALKGENLSTGQKTRLKTLEEAKSLAMKNSPIGTSNLIEAEFKVRERMVIAEKKMSESTRQQLEWELQTLDTQKEQVMLLGQQVEKENLLASKAKAKVENKYSTGNNQMDLSKIEVQANAQGAVQSHLNSALKIASQGQRLDDSTLDSTGRAQIGSALEEQIQKITKQANNLGENLNNIKGFDSLSSKVKDFAKDSTISLQEIIDLIIRVQDALSQGVTSKPVIQDEVNNQIGIKKQSIQDSQSVVSSIDNLQGIKKVTSRDTADTALADIKKNLGSIKEDKLTSKDAKAKIKQWKEQANAIDKTKLSVKEYKEKVNNLINDIKKHTNVQDKNNKTLRGSYNANKRVVEQNKDLSKTEKQITEDLTKTSDAMIQNAETNTDYEESLKGVIDGYEGLNAQLEYTGPSFQSFSNFFANGLSNLTSYAMGLSMLSSSVEQIGNSIAKGEGGLTNWISNISSLMLGIGMLIPAMTSMTAGIQGMTRAKLLENIATGVGVTLTGADTAAKEANLKATLEDAKASGDLAAKKALEALSHAGAIVAQSWGAAIGVALMAVGLIAPIIGGISGFSSGAKEVKQEEVSKGTESLEAINENQELAESVSDLTEEYQALRASGESTAEVLENMQDKIPELIDSYKELAKTMGTHIDTSGLEEAYKVFEETGDISLYQKEQERIDKDIKDKEQSTAKNTMNKARELVTKAASSGIGDGYFGDQYGTDLGSISGEDKKIFEDALGDYYKESEEGIRFSLTDSGELVDVYEGMLKARSELEKKYSPEELKNLEYYNKLNEEIKEMSENMPDVIQSQQALFDIEKEEALADEAAFNKQKGLWSIGSVEEYRKSREALIKKIQEETEWTTAQAEAYLKASDAYGAYESAVDFFGEGGLAGFDENTSKEKVEAIQNWFASLSEEERTLAMTIDYTIVNNEDEAKKALEEAREKAEEAGILKEALELEVDDATFETYVEGIASINKGLDKNKNLTKQIALNNLKISKGLETLTKSWDDNFEVLSRGNKASFEYAEAVGETKKALEEMFGVKPSTEYIEKYKNQLNDMVNGNLDSLQQLQDALAEDYIINMEFSTAINENWSGTIADAQAQLRGLLDDIDTSVEIGKESTLSSDFLDSVQGMLDAGVIAEEQLESLFRAKGYELNITGWKKIPGPVKKITQTTYDPKDSKNKTTKIIEEQEDINVPIINGKAPEGASGPAPSSIATVTKSPDKRVIDTSAAEEKADKKQDRLDSLKYEKDRYHEINEIISDTQRELDRLGKAKDRAFGASKLKLMEQEVAKQKELIKNNEELLKQAQEYAAADKKDLIANTASNLSIQFDEYGRIANYEELQNAYIKRLKNAAGNEELYDDISEEYDAFKDAAKKYEESLNKVEEQAEKINDELDALYEKNLEKIEYNIQIKVDIADDDKAYIDFLMQKIEDDAFAAADAIGLMGREVETIMSKIEANQQGIIDIQNAVANGYITPEQGAEKLREYRDELIDLNTDLLEVRQTVQDKLTEAFEAWNEKIEEGTSKLEFYSSVLEGYKNIIDIVGKDMLGISDETINNLNQTIISNANDSIRATKAQLDANKATLENMKRAREEARARGDEEAVKDWDKQIKVAEEKVQELTTTLQDKLSTGLKAVTTAFGDTVNQIAEEFSKAVSGIYASIEEMRQDWDRQQEVAERFLNIYEQTYEINKLNRQIQNSIDQTNNIGSQRELRDLQQEIYEMAKDGQQLSKYDLEYLQKKYDLLVAEQAFRDAQNAKSVVRLQRDSEGNFGYVYTADQGAVDNAEQNYEDKLYAFQEYTHKMDEELAEMYISVQEQAYERMQAAAEMYGEGTEAFERERQKILEQYNIDMGYITDEYEKLTDRNLDINQRFNAGVAETYEQTFINSIVPQYQSFEQLYDETTTQCEASCTRLDEAITLLQQTFDKQLELAGQDLDKFEKTANGKLEKIQGDSSTTAGKVEDMAGRMNTALNGSGGAIDAVEGFQKAYSSQMEAVRSATDNTIQRVNDLIKEYGKLAEAAGNDYTPSKQNPETTSGGNIGDSNTVKGKTDDGKIDQPLTYSNSTTYKTLKPSQGAAYSGYVKLADDKGNYVGYVKRHDAGTINRMPIGTSVAVNEDEEIYKYLVYKNGTVNEKWNDGQFYNNYSKNTATAPTYNSYGDPPSSAKVIKGAFSGRDDALANLNKVYLGDTPYYWGGGIGSKDGKVAFYSADQFDYKNFNGKNNKTLYLKSGAIGYHFYEKGGLVDYTGPAWVDGTPSEPEAFLSAQDTRLIAALVEGLKLMPSRLSGPSLRVAPTIPSQSTIEQNVHIEASFPNATNHNEIEEAFKNLTNLASQYANRK